MSGVATMVAASGRVSTILPASSTCRGALAERIARQSADARFLPSATLGLPAHASSLSQAAPISVSRDRSSPLPEQKSS